MQVNKIEISTDKVYLAAGGNPHIRLFDIAYGNSQPVHTYDNHTSNVTAVRACHAALPCSPALARRPPSAGASDYRMGVTHQAEPKQQDRLT